MKSTAKDIAQAIGLDLQASNNLFNCRVKVPTENEQVTISIIIIGRMNVWCSSVLMSKTRSFRKPNALEWSRNSNLKLLLTRN